MLLGAVSMEIESAIGVTFSILSAPCIRLIDAFNAGKLETARKEQALIQGFWTGTVHSSDVNAMIASFKFCMSILGLDFGPPRLPVQPLTSQQEGDIKKFMDGAFLKKLEL